MSNDPTLTPGEITAMLSAFNNAQLKIQETAGAAVEVEVEVRMRLIGQLSNEVRQAIKANIPKPKPGHKKPSSNYWNCDLHYIDKAIEKVFSSSLTSHESLTLMKFRDIRNKILHGDFVGLLEKLGISPTGRQISNTGTRNILKKADIIEAVKSAEKNRGFDKVRIQVNETKQILEKIIHTLSN